MRPLMKGMNFKMKQISTKNKIIGLVSILLVIVGLIVVLVGGFNVEQNYKTHDKIKIYVGEEIDIEKIEKAVKEVFGKNKAKVQKIEIYNDIFQVTAKEITEEQKNAFVDKINELYPVKVEENVGSTENVENAENIENVENTGDVENVENSVRVKKEDVKIVTVSNVRLRDIFKPYVMPFIIATLCILIYIAIRYRKLGVVKVILETGGILLGFQILLLSVLAIIRFPMGRFTSPMMLVAYMVSVLYISHKWKVEK